MRTYSNCFTGDYCDSNVYVVSECDFTRNVQKLVRFVTDVSSTGLSSLETVDLESNSHKSGLCFQEGVTLTSAMNTL